MSVCSCRNFLHTRRLWRAARSVSGDVTDIDRMVVDGTVDTLSMTLFDYAIRNARPIRLVLDKNVVRVDDLQLVGEDTQLTVGGTVCCATNASRCARLRRRQLGILQGFFKDVAFRARRLRGDRRSVARTCVLRQRHHHQRTHPPFLLPNALDAINGTIRFDRAGSGSTMSPRRWAGARAVRWAGRPDGYLPGDLSVSVRGEDMRLRYPENIRSVVDADLAVGGNVKAPSLAGRVTVKSAVWNSRVDPNGGLLNFGGSRAAADVAPAPVASVIPLRFDIEVLVPSTLRVENNLARLVASADLQLRGTYDRPLLFGRAQVDRGEVMFEGRRYIVTRGNIDFTNRRRSSRSSTSKRRRASACRSRPTR